MSTPNIEQILNHSFKDQSLIDEALTHPSVNHLSQDASLKDYERLEFLGDAVLSLAITETLLEKFPDVAEGELAKKRSYLIKGVSLAKIAKKVGLDQFILLSRSEERHGGRKNKNILENVVESIIGALYLDAGFDKCREFIKEHWESLLAEVIETPIEPKTFVQEWAQNIGLKPEYHVKGKTGGDHNPEFTVEIKIGNYRPYTGVGLSKKNAEKNAAHNFMINEINDK